MRRTLRNYSSLRLSEQNAFASLMLVLLVCFSFELITFDASWNRCRKKNSGSSSLERISRTIHERIDWKRSTGLFGLGSFFYQHSQILTTNMLEEKHFHFRDVEFPRRQSFQMKKTTHFHNNGFGSGNISRTISDWKVIEDEMLLQISGQFH